MVEPANRIRKLVAFAAADSGPEGPIARTKAREAIKALDTELLDTLAGQRKQLLEELRAESRRLSSSRERATKNETGELVTSALTLLQHYERYDALIAAVIFMRIEDGHALTNDERQQLEGPVEDLLTRWSRQSAEHRRAEREKRRAKARAARRAKA